MIVLYSRSYHCQLALAQFPAVRAIAARHGMEDFTRLFARAFMDIASRTGPRTLNVQARMTAIDMAPEIEVVVTETQGPLHFLARLWWAPINALRGNAPWHWSLASVIPVDIIALSALDQAAQRAGEQDTRRLMAR